MKTWLESLGQDIRYGVRGLRKSPGFAAAAIVLLALGIGGEHGDLQSCESRRPASTSFSRSRSPRPYLGRLLGETVAQHAQTRPLPTTWPGGNRASRSPIWRRCIPNTYNLTGTEANRPSSPACGRWQTSSPFLGIAALLGRTLDAADERSDAVPVVVVSEPLWRSRFAADPNVIGRSHRAQRVESHGRWRRAAPTSSFPDQEAVVWVAGALLAPGARWKPATTTSLYLRA
jgi:hypothetical protein